MPVVRLMTSHPAVMFPHWSDPPICVVHLIIERTASFVVKALGICTTEAAAAAAAVAATPLLMYYAATGLLARRPSGSHLASHPYSTHTSARRPCRDKELTGLQAAWGRGGVGGVVVVVVVVVMVVCVRARAWWW